MAVDDEDDDDDGKIGFSGMTKLLDFVDKMGCEILFGTVS